MFFDPIPQDAKQSYPDRWQALVSMLLRTFSLAHAVVALSSLLTYAQTTESTHRRLTLFMPRSNPSLMPSRSPSPPPQIFLSPLSTLSSSLYCLNLHKQFSVRPSSRRGCSRYRENQSSTIASAIKKLLSPLAETYRLATGPFYSPFAALLPS